MSRSTVRRAVATYLSSPMVPGVGTVFASPPKISTAGDAFEALPAGTPTGAVLYVETLQGQEIRVAVGGPTAGAKLVTYEVRIHLLARSSQAKSEDAMDDHDAILQAILQRLRADRTLGTAGSSNPILQAGEGDAGITYQTGMPKRTGNGGTHIWSLVDFQAQEWLVA